MSRSSEAASMKPRCTHVLGDVEIKVLSVVKGKKNIGICAADVKKEINLPPPIVKKALELLEIKKKIKLVVNNQNKRKKHYMAVEFKPSEEAWWANKEYVAALVQICLKVLDKLKVATMKGISTFIKEHKLIEKHELADCTDERVAQTLEYMVLNHVIKEVESTGLAEYHSIPVGSVCYLIARGPKTIGNMASIPCSACPRISKCTPNGIISPKTCVFYTRWLKLEF
ncbi:uncharacterized protein LOC132602065 [Lycium barbarum]|uniref:uncharacterized protein LOC132602065 n=1 Tax=Lycium barbarum TaxID=112863 RepID=UPI00293F429B|nr:uncharacterized protein LOC132602065 [Lycium barbarum]